MQRYFTEASDWDDQIVRIKGNDAHHIGRVMRKIVGEQIICNHPNGEAAICEIINLSKDIVELHVIEWLTNDAELPMDITIAQSLPKGNKLELILQKGTELGANRFILFEANRSIAKWDERKSKQKLNRYEKILKESSEQCHRNRIPEIEIVTSLEAILIDHSKDHMILYAYEEEAKKDNHSSLATALTKMKPQDRVLIFIGPEGGFTKEEIELFKKYECQSVRLGSRILRTETASMYALASISYHFEELRSI